MISILHSRTTEWLYNTSALCMLSDLVSVQFALYILLRDTASGRGLRQPCLRSDNLAANMCSGNADSNANMCSVHLYCSHVVTRWRLVPAVAATVKACVRAARASRLVVPVLVACLVVWVNVRTQRRHLFLPPFLFLVYLLLYPLHLCLPFLFFLPYLHPSLPFLHVQPRDSS